MAKEAFNKRRELLVGRLNLALRERMIKTLVWPVLLYGCETWTLTKEERSQLEAFDMWAWRKIQKVHWRDRKTNEEILIMVGEKRTLMGTITNRKRNWISHVLGGEVLLRDVIEGRMQGTRRGGRRKIGMLDDILVEGSY